MNEESAREALATLWERHGLSRADIQPLADGTLVATQRTELLESQATLFVDDSSESEAVSLSPEALEIGELLGQGGMGEVHLARQTGLRRDVAVKTVRFAGMGSATSSLLKEAWVGGSLEHPNVVPVHTLARSEGGPAVVMKRIEGVEWAKVLEDPSRHERFASGGLDAHLEVLNSVCHAIEFAHSRGILHLDLKPDNIMVGSFGEVYVLDWGLAVGVEGAPPWLSKATEISSVAGTPAYMAPELAAGSGDSIDQRTDVYLLGGLLHTVLTGNPLHEGANVYDLLMRAFVSEPKAYGPEVADGLAAIVHRATHADPAQRHPSVAAFREAIRAFQEHRRADRLAKTAEHALEQVAALVGEGTSDVEAEPRFAEIEVAIESARRTWPDHPRLRPAAERLLELRAMHALAQERADAADAFIEEMREPSEEIIAATRELRQELAGRREREARLEEMSHELDFSLGSAVRRRIFATGGAAWFLISVAFGWLTRSGLHDIGYRELVIEGGLLVAALIPIGYALRHTAFQNRANRRLYGGLFLTLGAVELHWIVCLLLGIAAQTAIGFTSLYYVFAFSMLAVALDRRLFWAAGCMTAGAILIALMPEYTHEWLGFSGGAAVAATLIAWRPSRAPIGLKSRESA